jgi:hypothetical protein
MDVVHALWSLVIMTFGIDIQKFVDVIQIHSNSCEYATNTLTLFQ